MLQLQDAIKDMRAVVLSLVEESVGQRNHIRAVICVKLLRKACVGHGQAGAFNSLLQVRGDIAKELRRVMPCCSPCCVEIRGGLFRYMYKG